MLALGSVKAALADGVKSGRVHFDVHGFLTGVVLADLGLSGTRRSAGSRCLLRWVGQASPPPELGLA